MTNMDKLYEAVEARGPVCVGLDTDFSYLPADFVDSTLTRGENIVRFNQKLIDATKAVAGCYKVQIAYYESLGLEGMKAYADTLKAVREAVGPDVDLLVEVHRRLSPYHAIHFSERIQEFNPFWIEEPCLADNIDLIAQAHAGIKAPVVTGETLYNKEAFIPVFEKHAAEIINPDICVSGIKVMSEISAMAEPYSVLMSPHNFNSNAVGLAAMIHLSASIPNFLIGEMFLTVDEASREIMVEPFEIKNGYVALPTKPGLGIDIDMDKLAQRPYKFFERKFPFKGACDYRDEFPKEGM